MKKYYLFFLPMIIAAILLYSFSGDDARYPGGSPAGYTGSPGDGKNCTQCHGGTASPVIGWITSDIDSSGYVPGQSYAITVTVSGNGKKGFEVSPQDIPGNLLGTLTAGDGSELTGNGKYVTQSSSSNSNPKVWTFGWTAPEAGTGPVTFYGAFTVTEPVTKLCQLVVQENTGVFVREHDFFPGKIYPNPVTDRLNIDLNHNKDGRIRISIHDLQGREVKRIFEGQPNPSMVIVSSGLGELPDGVYIVSLRDDEFIHSRKIIVSR